MWNDPWVHQTSLLNVNAKFRDPVGLICLLLLFSVFIKMAVVMHETDHAYSIQSTW